MLIDMSIAVELEIKSERDEEDEYIEVENDESS